MDWVFFVMVTKPRDGLTSSFWTLKRWSTRMSKRKEDKDGWLEFFYFFIFLSFFLIWKEIWDSILWGIWGWKRIFVHIEVQHGWNSHRPKIILKNCSFEKKNSKYPYFYRKTEFENKIICTIKVGTPIFFSCLIQLKGQDGIFGMLLAIIRSMDALVHEICG